jgi:nicotinate-nucleotide adenylyltransferase
VARVGLLGGTFNPPHIAHLICAQEALVQLRLDRVLLVPVAVAPHKTVEAEPGVAHRVAMCEAAVAGDDRFGVSRADADRDGPSYTVDLLRALRAESPGDELTFIVGGDMAYSLPAWRDPEGVLALAQLAVAEREGVRRADIRESVAGLAGASERLRFFEMPRLDISSSLIRRRAAGGQPVRYLVPDPVAAYMERQRLYRDAARPSPGARLSLGTPHD